MGPAKKKRSHSSATVPKTVKIEEKRKALAGMHPGTNTVPLVSIKECSHLLNVSVSTIQRLVRAGTVPSVMVGRSRKYDMVVVRAAIDRKS